MGITVLVIAIAWYQKLKPKKEIDCDCEEEKTAFIQTKTFLAIVTIFAALMLAFPYYSNIFYPEAKTSNIEITQGNLETIEFSISGMTCTSCEQHITYSINELKGINSINASYEKGNAIVQFDKSKTNKKEITKAINATGYNVTN